MYNESNIDSNDVEYEMNMITHKCNSKSTLKKYLHDVSELYQRKIKC